MTNSLESVPKKFRSKMTIIKEDAPKPVRPLPEAQQSGGYAEPGPVAKDEQALSETKKAAGADKSRYIRTALVVASVIAGFFIMRWFGSTLGYPGVGTLLFLLVTIFSGIYLYRMYVVQLTDVFGTLKKDATNIRKNVETREQKTDQMLKQQLDKEKLD